MSSNTETTPEESSAATSLTEMLALAVGLLDGDTTACPPPAADSPQDDDKASSSSNQTPIEKAIDLLTKLQIQTSQLSGNYKDTACDGVTKVFLDHDPDSFRTLLAYMRYGMIDAAAVDRGVLLLAEYLQMEELLVATKARAYQNLTGSMMNESTAAEMFDETYGGIRTALTKGILPESMKEDPSKEKKKKFAVLIIESDCDYGEPFRADT